MDRMIPILRLAGAADLPAVQAINAEAAPGVSPLSKRDLETMLQTATRFWVAEIGGRVAGYLLAFTAEADYAGDEFLWFAAQGQDFLYVDQVAIAAGQRGRGLGGRLYAEGSRWAKARRLTRLTCEVNLRPENPGSLRFHRRQGFREVGQIETADGRLVSLQSKTLTANGR
ncbi:MAG: GNAT family N-acetyltransferase [Gemmatimonadales bacterium]